MALGHYNYLVDDYNTIQKGVTYDRINSASDHNEASTNLRMILYMTAGQQFRIGTIGISSGTTNTVDGANSNWIIQKVG